MKSISDVVTAILHDAEVSIRAVIQDGGNIDGWTSCKDEDGNITSPSDEREVLVFLCGDRDPRDERPGDAGYGLRLGWFDHDRNQWRVCGSPERYVTHWRDLPPAPTVKV